ncbi:uncharacterized protein BX664DRAFT_356665 [Halteromyces radiatus]|uniref:uncharacterized protein n=1 Tax=Halteromyces radiatus TaxID=101107 RepID=UPI0022207322|nr:uncharacterized protein BX664DRAFT_356665 [Halteromyces radiatus]KAI8097418.1 hypothetical protein BX664DRAFT_356665 [Halteromyces radiatus]
MTTFNTQTTTQQEQVSPKLNFKTQNRRQQYQLTTQPIFHQQSGQSTSSTLNSTFYTTTKQSNNNHSTTITATETLSTSFSHTVPDVKHDDALEHSDMIDQDNLDDAEDEDDVEIIMHNEPNAFNYTGSGLDNHASPINSSPVAAALDSQYHQQHQHKQHKQQQQQQLSSDPDHPTLDSSPSSIPSSHHHLQRQLEYYFSRQNLANDSYLVSQMNPDLYVPIATIAKFRRVLDITTDMDLIVSTLRRSPVVIVNETGTMVKPNISVQRTTVILRDVADTNETEIKQFLQELGTPPIKSIKNEYANMWYITFESEDHALKMLYDCRGKSFKGQPVAARMKSEPVVGSIQARKSALQAESTASPKATTTTITTTTTTTTNIATTASNTHNDNDQRQSLNDNPMKNYIYNGYYIPFNSPMTFRHHWPIPYSSHPGNIYPNYIPNGNQNGGRFNNNNNKRGGKSGRGRYKNNNHYGDMIRNNSAIGTTSTSTNSTPVETISTSFSSPKTQHQTRTNGYKLNGSSQSQRSQPAYHPSTSHHEGLRPSISSPSPTMIQSSYHYPAGHHQNYHYQQNSHYRGQKNRGHNQLYTQWRSNRQSVRNNNNHSNNTSTNTNNYYISHKSSNMNHIDSNTAAIPVHQQNFESYSPTNQQHPLQNHRQHQQHLQKQYPQRHQQYQRHQRHQHQQLQYQHQNRHFRNQASPISWPHGTASPISGSSSSSTSSGSLDTKDKVTASAISITTTTPATTNTSLISPTSSSKDSSTSTTPTKSLVGSLDAKSKRKPKWDKKRKNRKQSTTSANHVTEEEIDLQSGTYFPPLPGSKFNMIDTTTSDSTTTTTMTVSTLLNERLSAADVVKKGGQDKTPTISSSTPGLQKIQQQKKVMTSESQRENMVVIKENQRPLEEQKEQEESFPLLCPVQEVSVSSSSFSYADMLKKKEN